MHLKLGFKDEGCGRKEIYKNGKYRDRINFGILREEWEEKNNLKKPAI
ncbi:MAG: GNAT family N-acetyltransferase [Candidatus Andersenbacteria bacterium]|nr:GNAT family N-acetyltransferase [Candidatus Andersenbacteria bacterium]